MPPRRTKLLLAKFEQTLIFADSPQVVVLDPPGNSKVVGVAVDYPGYEYPFFGAQVSNSQFGEYLAERFDLRYLFMRADFKRHFLFDLFAQDEGEVKLFPMQLSGDRIEQFVPGQGIFARDHTDPYASPLLTKQTVEKYDIAGAWDLPEFASFYSQVTGLYALFNSVDLFLNEQAAIDDRRRVRDAFIKPWQGGGSYVSFYDSLLAVQPRGNRLHVGGIQYHSPGYVEVRGNANTFQEIRDVVSHFQTQQASLSESYKSLYGFLSEMKLLRLAAVEFSNEGPLAEEIRDRSEAFAGALNAIDFDSLLKMAQGHQLIAAKVLLSVYRKAARLYECFIQGRVSLTEIGGGDNVVEPGFPV